MGYFVLGFYQVYYNKSGIIEYKRKNRDKIWTKRIDISEKIT